MASFRGAPAQTSRPLAGRRPQRSVNRVSRPGFNAFALDKPALAFSVGRATLVRGMARRTFGVKATVNGAPMPNQTHVVAVLSAHPGVITGQIAGVARDHSTVSVQHVVVMDSAGFSALGPSSSSPDSALTARLSVRLRNISPALEVAGQCYSLNMASGLGLLTQDNWVNLIDYVESHPRTVTYSAHELRSCRQWNAHPVDQSAYHRFTSPGTDANAFQQGLLDPGMSTIVLVFPIISSSDALADQQYELTVQGQYYTRYRVTGPLAHAAEAPPTMPLPILNAARDAAEAVGSFGMHALGEFAQGAGQAAMQALTSGRVPFRAQQLMAPPPMLVD